MSAADEFDIEPLSSADPNALAALHREVMGEAEGWSDSGLKRLLTAEAARGFQARNHGIWAGYILAFAAADEAEILALCVTTPYRRRGLARAMLGLLTDLLVSQDIVSLHLEVRISNFAARRLYAANGFSESGRRKAYYHNADGSPNEDAVVMTKILRGQASALITARR